MAMLMGAKGREEVFCFLLHFHVTFHPIWLPSQPSPFLSFFLSLLAPQSGEFPFIFGWFYCTILTIFQIFRKMNIIWQLNCLCWVIAKLELFWAALHCIMQSLHEKEMFINAWHWFLHKRKNVTWTLILTWDIFNRALKFLNTDLCFVTQHSYLLLILSCVWMCLINCIYFFHWSLLGKYIQVKSSLSDWLFLVFPFIPLNLTVSLLWGILANVSMSSG